MADIVPERGFRAHSRNPCSQGRKSVLKVESTQAPTARETSYSLLLKMGEFYILRHGIFMLACMEFIVLVNLLPLRKTDVLGRNTPLGLFTPEPHLLSVWIGVKKV